ncbi:MAG: uracil-DNA glycosylase [Clostridiales bacterium]|nr:uracil-DNA glycosylase [Clostridiales bacterium]
MDNQWNILEKECMKCEKCNLHSTRKNVVIERGNRQAKILFIGEGPGAREDESGIAFVGQAGKLLDLALGSMGIYEKDIYICNIIKCRPPNNANPTDEQAKACMPYLKKQIELVNPLVIVLLGSVALKRMINSNLTITKNRGNWMEYEGIKVLPTFHPAALLRDEKKKIVFWKDINKAWKSITD